MTKLKSKTKADVMASLHNDLHDYQDGMLSIGIICQRIADWHDAEIDRLNTDGCHCGESRRLKETLKQIRLERKK